MPKKQVLIKGHIDAIGQEKSRLIIKLDKAEKEQRLKVNNHNNALKLALESLKQYRIIKSFDEIDAIGHRVVHGGAKYSRPVKISSVVLKDIKDLCALAPLHNHANLAGIIACQKILKGKPQIAVFDTSFHQTMPERSYTYPLPRGLCKEEKIRKYGFHGISHRYVSEKAYKLLGKKKGGIITCHLGNGCSITAIKNGKSVDTSMGFTPAGGIFMGTRTGAIDPGIFTFLLKEKKYTVEQWDHLINQESGFKGITGTNDVRIIHDKVNRYKKYRLALDMFSHKLSFYIAGYSASLDTLDAIVFTAGIGEKAFYVRATTLDMLKHLGVRYDKKKNEKNMLDITAPASKVKIFVIPTNEELEIAKEVMNFLR